MSCFFAHAQSRHFNLHIRKCRKSLRLSTRQVADSDFTEQLIRVFRQPQGNSVQLLEDGPVGRHLAERRRMTQLRAFDRFEHVLQRNLRQVSCQPEPAMTPASTSQQSPSNELLENLEQGILGKFESAGELIT